MLASINIHGVSLAKGQIATVDRGRRGGSKKLMVDGYK